MSLCKINRVIRPSASHLEPRVNLAALTRALRTQAQPLMACAGGPDIEGIKAQIEAGEFDENFTFTNKGLDKLLDDLVA